MTRTPATIAAAVWIAASLAATAPTPAAAQAEPPSAAEPDAAVGGRADLGAVNELVRAGSYVEAETSLAALQQDFPDDPRILLMRGELLLAIGRPPDALPILRQCAEIDPALPRLHFQLATALQAVGDASAALEEFGREIEINADPRVQVLAHLNRSLLRERNEDRSGAADEIVAALALDPARLEAYGDAAALYLEADRLDEASHWLDRGFEAGFRSPQHLYSLGARYLSRDSFEPAVAAFRKALEIDPSYAEAARSLAVALDRMGRSNEAVQQFRRYLELRPDAPDATRIAERIREVEGG